MKRLCVIGAIFNVLDVSKLLGVPPKTDHPSKPLTWNKSQVCRIQVPNWKFNIHNDVLIVV